MAFKYTALNSIVGKEQHTSSIDHVYDLDARYKNAPGAIAHIVTSVGVTNITIQKSGTYKVYVLGAGGAGSYSNNGDYAGDGGFFAAEIPFVGGDALEIGVGQGGVYNGTSAQISGGSYVMRGGQGFAGYNQFAGDGGGGSYIKVTNGASTANYANYVIIAGGGGGCGNHGFTANWGGYGFGVGGCGWSQEWSRTTGSSTTGGGGYNGYDGSGGGGGYPRATVNAWNYGGSADNLGQYHGGDGGHPVSSSTSDYAGGGGGGGAGGGGGSGCGGVASNNIGGSAVNGGYLSTSTTVGSYTAEIVPRGGGGGGAHTNDCAGTGGGGGALLFTAHNTSWGSGTMGSDVPYHNSGSRQNDYQLSAINEYNAYADLSTYSTTYFGYNMTTSNPASGGIQGLGYGGAYRADGTNGCVIIANLNEIITPTIL